MGITGSWAQRAREDYTGATKWGTGYNRVHEVRDNGRGRVIGSRENLLPLGEPSDVVADSLAGGEIDWVSGDYADSVPPGEHFRYQDDRPRWNQTTPDFRDNTNSPAMGETPAWGPHYDSDPYGFWPLPGPTGGMQGWLDVDHGEVAEQQRAIAVPTAPVSGGWMGKVRGATAVPMAQEVTGSPNAQWAIDTAQVQGPGLKQLSNDRAVARGTDAPRSAIMSRTAGMVEKLYGRSFRMGGGAGTPDMFPYQQTPGLKRPFITRAPALPPDAVYQWNTQEGRTPYQRATPADPYQGDPEVGSGDDVGDWGY